MALIGIDVGTSATKGLVISDEGAEIGAARSSYSVQLTDDGRAELDSRIVWKTVLAVLGELAGHARENRDQVRALAFSVSGNEATPVDADGTPLYPTIMGTDTRSADIVSRWEKQVGRLATYQATGIPAHPMHPLMRLMWLREHEPEVFRRIDKMLCWQELMGLWLGAPPVADLSIASCTMAFDIRQRTWSHDMLAAAGIDRDLFPEAVPAGTAIGKMSAGLSDQLGFGKPPVIVAGGFDQPVAALGAGQVAAGNAGIGTGTWEALLVVSQDAPVTPSMLDAGYSFSCYVVGDLYYTAGNNPGGGSVLQWFRDTFGEREIEEARRTGKSAFDLIVRQATESPTDLMVLPHFEGSYNPWMDPWSRGAVVGLTLATTKGDIIKAVLEGITYELRENMRRMEAAGLSFGELIATGGGARSDTWLQLKADMCGKVVRTVNIDETGCFGAACLAGAGVGMFADAAEPIRQLVRTRKVFEPRPDHQAFYADAANRYCALYEALRPLNPRPGRVP
jgi:xylulokinase